MIASLYREKKESEKQAAEKKVVDSEKAVKKAEKEQAEKIFLKGWHWVARLMLKRASPMFYH